MEIKLNRTGEKYFSSVHGYIEIINYYSAYNSFEEAFKIYKNTKEEYIKEVAEIWKYKITHNVYQALKNYLIEITD